MTAPRFSHFFISLGIATVATLFALVGQNTLLPLRFWFYDAGLTSRAPRKPPDIVILGIDERFMAGRHAFLAPRDRLAALITNIAAGKPKAIALDVWLDSRIDDRQNGDFKLKKALERAKNLGIPVILSDVPLEQSEYASSSRNSLSAHGSVISYFAQQARIGSVFFTPEDDGTVRLHSPEMPNRPSLALQMARLGGAKPGLQRKHVMPIAFCGPPGTIDTQSAADFLQPELSTLLQGKLVFIGATYPRSGDYSRTPYSIDKRVKPMYGVELLAQATNALRSDVPLRSDQTGEARRIDFLIVFLACLLITLAGLRGNLLGVVMTFSVLLVAVFAAVCSARDGGPLWGFRFHDATPFLLASPFALATAVGWRSWTTARELRLVRDTFGAYVGPEVLKSLGGKMPELGGETRQIAVLFCDIRGYSALAESMSNDPKALLDELNAHFAPLVSALKKRGAYVDNYVGDLVMALFGAPVSAGDFQKDVQAATLAALDFVQLVESRNQKRRENGQIPIEIGIGVHCGVAVVGNIGTHDPKNGGKIHYTAIGDVVNVASRVESATRGQNVALLVTREVVEAVGETTGLRAWQHIGEIIVKGRQNPVEVFKTE